MPKQQPSSNPLLGKNIPPPPLAGPEKTVSEENGKPVERQGEPVRSQEKLVKERATVELSLYLRPSQDDKVEDLRRAYKKRTGKKISANELMRRLIDRATLETLL